MKNNKVIYSLNVEDIQIVAQETLNRELSNDETRIIIDSIQNKINWHAAIEDSINEKII